MSGVKCFKVSVSFFHGSRKTKNDSVWAHNESMRVSQWALRWKEVNLVNCPPEIWALYCLRLEQRGHREEKGERGDYQTEGNGVKGFGKVDILFHGDDFLNQKHVVTQRRNFLLERKNITHFRIYTQYITT